MRSIQRAMVACSEVSKCLCAVKGSQLSTRLLAGAVILNWALTLYYWNWLSELKSAAPQEETSLIYRQANVTLNTPLNNARLSKTEPTVNDSQAGTYSTFHVVPELRAASKLKWYVYNVPQRFLSTVHESRSNEYNAFCAELYFLREVEKRRVAHPEDADVFYVPILTSALLVGLRSEHKSLENQASPAVRNEAIRMVESVIAWVQTQFPYWNKSSGSNHVFFFSHENGPCLDISADRAIENARVLALQDKLQTSIILTHTGDHHSGCFRASQSILLPPALPDDEAVLKKLNGVVSDYERARSVWLYFRDRISVQDSNDEWQAIRVHYGEDGSVENRGISPGLEACIDTRKIRSAAHCERANDKCKEAELFRRRVLSRGIRQNLAIYLGEFAQACTNCTARLIQYSAKVKDISTRIAEMSDATFCLSTRGFADWNVRTYEAMVAGCIPVIVSDDARLPLSDVVDWSRISIRIREARVQNIYEVLSRVSEGQIVDFRKRISAALPHLTYPHLHPDGQVFRHAEDQLATLLRQRAGGRGAEGAEGAEGAGSNVSSKAYPRAIEAGEGVRGLEVCLAVQMSPDRLSMLAAIAQRWHGHIYAVVNVRGAPEEFNANQVRKDFFAGFELSEYQRFELQQRVELEFYRAPSSWKWYPVNLLRNMALRGCAARAQFAMTVDVDFVPNTDAYRLLKSYCAKLLKADAKVRRRALVVPAFETSDDRVKQERTLDELLNSKQAIVEQYRVDDKYRQRQTKRTKSMVWPFDQKRSTTGHRATNSEYWMGVSSPYRVDYKWGWEPYLLLRAPFPEYDETFVEYGQNKVMYAYELLAAGFEFVVLPDAYLVHAHVDPNKKNSASKPKQFHVGWSCWADFVVRVQDTYDGFRLPTPCWAAKYVYPEVTNVYQDQCIGNPPGQLTHLG